MKTYLIKLLLVSCLFFLGLKNTQASITVSETGITNSGTTVAYGQTAAVFGFSVVTNAGTAFLNTVSFSTGNNYLLDLPAAGISLVSSATANYNTSTTLTPVGATLATTGTTLTFTVTTPNQTISTTKTYYFLVVTFNGTAALTLPDNFTFTLGTVTSKTPTNTFNANDVGTRYNFVNSTFTVDQTPITNLTANPLTGTLTNLGLFGMKVTSTGNATITGINFISSSILSTSSFAATGATVTLYSSTSSVFPGTSLAGLTSVASKTVASCTTTTVNFTVPAGQQTISDGVPIYYYIVLSNYTAPATNTTFSFNINTFTATNNTTTPPTYVGNDQSGPVYNLNANLLTVANNATGVIASPINTDLSNASLFSFSAVSSSGGTANISSFTFTGTTNISTTFSSVSLYSYSNATFPGVGTATLVKAITPLPNSTTMTVSGLTESIASGSPAVYYYLVVNYIDNVATATTSSFQFKLTAVATSNNLSGTPVSGTNYTISSPVTLVTAATLANMAPNPITSTLPANSGIMGFTITTTQTETFKQFNFTATQNIATYFSGLTLWVGATNDISAATQITASSVAVSGTSLIISGLTQTQNAGTLYYFIKEGTFNVPTASTTFELDCNSVANSTPTTYTNGAPAKGTNYTITAPTLTENQTTGGLYTPTTIVGNQSNLPLSGISLVSANGNTVVTTLNYTATQTITNNFSGMVNLYTSTSSTFSMGTATLIASQAAPASTNISFNLPVANQTITGTPVYFYLVMDTYTPPTTNSTFEFDVSTVTSAYAVTYTDKTGTSYTLTAPTLTQNQTIGGLYSRTTISDFQTNLPLSGISLTSANGNSSVTVLNYTASQTISTYFSGNVSLYTSTSSTFSMGTATLIASKAAPATTTISFNVPAANQAVNSGTPVYFYLVMDANKPPATQATFEFDVNTITTAYAITYSDKTGTSYTLAPAVTIGAATTTGLAANPLNYSQLGIGIYGFSVTTTASESFTQFNFTSAQAAGTNIGTYFSNIKIYANTTNTFTNAPANQVAGVTVTPLTLNTQTLALSFATPQTVVPGTPIYYFIVADFNDPSTANTFQLNIKNAITSTTTYTNGTPVAGTIYNVGPATNNWVGGSGATTATKTDWNTAANWSYNAVPLPADNVQIGVTNFTVANSPVISTPVTVASITFASNSGSSAISLTANSPLQVNGDITIAADNSSTGNQTVNFKGTSSIGANNITYADNFSVNFNSIVVNSSVASLNISNNISLLTNGFLFFAVNATFNLTGGVATVAGNLKSINNSFISIFFIPTSTFTVTNSTLILTNPNVFNLNNVGNNVVLFDNSGAVVNYAGASQTLYTTAAITGLAGGVIYRSLILSGTGVKTPNAGTLNIDGDFTNSLANDATNNAVLTGIPVVFNGTITQSLAGGLGTGTTFKTVTFKNTGSKNINSGYFNVSSTGLLTVSGNAPVTVASGGLLTLVSDANNSASIGAITGSITGNVNVQRYLTGGNINYRGYRLLSSPVNISSAATGNIGLSYVNSDVALPVPAYGALTGGATGGGFTVPNGNPTMYLYGEGLVSNGRGFTDGKDVGITAITPTGVSVLSKGVPTTGVTVPAGNGYFLYFIGNDQTLNTASSRVPESTVITAIGTINQGDVAFKMWGVTNSTVLSYASPSAPVGYNLIGNPYASTIDLNKLYTDNGSKYPIFAVLNDVNPNQGFGYYNAGSGGTSGSAIASRYIASGQGFFVQATAVNQTLTFKEDQKIYNTAILTSTSTPPIALKLKSSKQITDDISAAVQTDTITDAIIIKQQNNLHGLHLMLQKDSLTHDECGIYFSKDWADNYDKNDAYIISGSSKINMYSFTRDNVPVGINSLTDYTQGKRIKLYVKSTISGVYNLKMTDIQNVDTSLFNIYLIDKFKNDSLDIVRYKSYAFDIATADTNSFGANRFVLAVERKSFPPYDLIAFTGQKVKAGVQLNWKTYNEGDYTGFVLQKKNNTGKFIQLDSLQSYSATDYSYIDKNPSMGNNVYRLKQNDISGNITYSVPVTITYNNGSVSSVFSVYPNPSREMITINVNAVTPTISNYISNIYNTAGELMGHRTINGNTWTEDITTYKAGIYIIELQGNDGSLVGKTKFVKTN